MVTISGLATARGFASGPVFIYRGDGDIPIPEYLIEPGREEEELNRLRRAVLATRRDLENLISALRERTGRADVRIFECHLMILEDETLNKEIEKHIVGARLNVEASVRKTFGGARAQFERMNDPYFRERVRDIDDVERRLLRAITGFGGNPHLELKVPSIVVADDLTPSETVQLPRDLVLGFATDGGSTTSHVALLARALAIPAVTGLVDITSKVTPGEVVLLDGTNGTVTVNPDRATVLKFGDLVERQMELAEEVGMSAPAGTLKDGGEVRLFANVHPGVPLDGIGGLGARGIGLYRSEYLWLNREIQPTEEQQFQAYRSVIKFATALGPKGSATIRALDIGGDKLVRGISAKESNPFLGNRSIRFLLSHHDVMKTQLRAILRASHYGRCCIMYPMVSCAEELMQAEEVFKEVTAQLDAEGIPYDREIPVGVMIEVPAAALNADQLAKHAKFFSIGTNDLVQYTMAADRGNEAVAHLYQPTNPAVLRLMRMTIDAAKRNGIPVGVCGESAADPVIGILWAAMGVDILSMSATYIPVIAKLCARLTKADLEEYAKVPESVPPDATAADILAACRAWMAAKIPDIDRIVL